MNSKKLLSSVLKTTQMGQVGIRSVLDTKFDTELRSAMVSQLKEYDTIEQEALDIAGNRHWILPEINPSIRFMTDRMTKMELSFGNVDSKIASMMIRGNTSGMIKGHKNLHQLSQQDDRVRTLAKKLLDTENANISQMKQFL